MSSIIGVKETMIFFIAIYFINGQDWSYSWHSFYKVSLTKCLYTSSHHDYLQLWNQTVQCYTSTWQKCLYQDKLQVEPPSYVSHQLCHKMVLVAPQVARAKGLQYMVTLIVPITNTINVTFTKFWMDRSRFGCKRNKMEVIDGSQRTEYCGVRDQWSNYSQGHRLQVQFAVFKLGSRFQVEMSTTILEIVEGRDNYIMLAERTVNIYRGHPHIEAFGTDDSRTSWDPVQV